jgi:hypothetical protein
MTLTTLLQFYYEGAKLNERVLSGSLPVKPIKT